MQIYVGYGFNVNELKPQDWLTLMREHDQDEYEDFVENTKENDGEENLDEKLLAGIEDRIGDISCLADYLRDIINDSEKEKAGTDYIVSSYDDFLVFDSVRFAGDSPRSNYIRTAEDFVQMIARYVPVENLTFGNLYEGSDWVDSCYCLD